MADIRPFAAFRPAPDLARRVASPPYDVLSSDEARVLAADEPLSFLHVNKAEIDLERGASEQEIHDRSAANLQRMIDEGVLIQDSSDCYYVYRLTMGAHTQLGVVAAASVDAYDNGRIKRELGVTLAHPDYRSGLRAVLAAEADGVADPAGGEQEQRQGQVRHGAARMAFACPNLVLRQAPEVFRGRRARA